MRILSTFTTIIAVLIALLIAFLTIYNLLFGNVSILLPGLGLIISSWLVIFVLAVVEAFVILLALYLRRSGGNFR